MLKDDLGPHVKKGGNMVYFGRGLEANHKHLWQRVIEETGFLPADCKFNERVYCIMNGLAARPKCPIKGKELRFINYFKGYPNTAGGFSFKDIKPIEGPITQDEIEYLKTSYKDFAETKANEFFVNHLDLVGRIKWNTSFLDPEITFAERAYCVVHGITTKPTTCFFTFERGYAPTEAKDNTAFYLQLAAKVGRTDREHGEKVWRTIHRDSTGLADLPISEVNKSFLLCPIYGEDGMRRLNIKEPYINNILLMSVDEFKAKYPNQLMSCDAHSQSLSKAMNRVEDNGLTVHANAMKKARISLLKVGADGLTGDERRGLKLRDINLNNTDQYGLNTYQYIAEVARAKQITTLEKNHKTLNDVDPLWVCYYNFCRWWTQPFEDDLLDGRPRGRNGVPGGYQIDHLYSITDGYRNRVSPFVISAIANLEVLPWEDNAQKQAKSLITLTELLNRCQTSVSDSNLEYHLFVKAVTGIKGAVSSITVLKDINKQISGANARVYGKFEI